MRSLAYVWRCLPPVARVVVLAAPAVCLAGVLALLTGGGS